MQRKSSAVIGISVAYLLLVCYAGVVIYIIGQALDCSEVSNCQPGNFSVSLSRNLSKDDNFRPVPRPRRAWAWDIPGGLWKQRT